MKNIYIVVICLMVGLSFSCNEDDQSFYVGVDAPEKGALISPTFISGALFLAGQADSEISFTLSSVGEAVKSVTILKSLNGGPTAELINVTDLSQPINITVTEAADGLGTTVNDLVSGDQFSFQFEGETESGSFISSNVANVLVACAPETKAVAYTSEASGTSTDGCCPGVFMVSDEVMVTYNGGIDFTVSDWSAGLYFAWYEVYGITAGMKTDGTFNGPFSELCLDLSGGFGEPFGATAGLEGTFDPATGIIQYTFLNAYGDTGDVTLTPK